MFLHPLDTFLYMEFWEINKYKYKYKYKYCQNSGVAVPVPTLPTCQKYELIL